MDSASILSKLIELLAWPNKQTILRREAHDNASIVTYGAIVGVRTCNGNYLMSDPNHDQQVFARERHVQLGEQFEIVDAREPFSIVPDRRVRYGDSISFRALKNQNSTGVNLNSHADLTAWVPHVQSWETFHIVRPPKSQEPGTTYVRFGNEVAFVAANGKSLRFDKDGDGSIRADVPYIDEWEAFRLIPADRPK